MSDELAPAFTVPPAVKRGRWVHHEVITWSGVITGAWQLDGLDWWLRKRTGAAQSLRWCSYCWREPYRWWQLHLCPPGEWLVLSPPNRYAEYSLEGLNRDERRLFPYPAGWEPGHGYCTHKRLLSSAMKSAEKALDNHILKVLAGKLHEGRSSDASQGGKPRPELPGRHHHRQQARPHLRAEPG